MKLKVKRIVTFCPVLLVSLTSLLHMFAMSRETVSVCPLTEYRRCLLSDVFVWRQPSFLAEMLIVSETI